MTTQHNECGDCFWYVPAENPTQGECHHGPHIILKPPDDFCAYWKQQPIDAVEVPADSKPPSWREVLGWFRAATK